MKPDSDDGAHERLARIDADGGEEHREAEVAQHDVGGQRHDPEHRTGAAQLAEDERDEQRAAADAERDHTDARNRNWDQSEQHAQHHANPERHVAELRCGLHGVAEMLADFLLAVGRHQHADAIAKLQRQIGRRHDVHVVAPDMQKMRRKAGRQRQLRKRNAHQIGLADEDANVVERGAILHDAAGLQPSELSPRPRRSPPARSATIIRPSPAAQHRCRRTGRRSDGPCEPSSPERRPADPALSSSSVRPA